MIRKGFIPVMIGAASLMMSVGVEACTGIYVGPEASVDGTILIARSNDHQDNWSNHLEITEAVENQPDRSMPVNAKATVFTPIPASTYRYVSTPWMDSTRSLNGLERDAASCANECGVAMTMSVTSFSNKAALEADPLIPDGLTEVTADNLVICQSATAREAVETLLSIIDTYGSSEVNIAFISDQSETWYIEMYSGHQYAAVKLPRDKVAVFGNEFTLRCVEDYPEYIVSKELVSLPESKGFAVYDEQGHLDLLKTYSGMEVRTEYSHMRTWIGHKTLAPSSYSDYSREDDYPLTFSAEKILNISDVMDLIRNRYEGTEYDPDATGRTDMRVIGTDTAMSVHVQQIDPELPADRSCTMWVSVAPAVYGVFVPVNNACQSVSETYGANQPAESAGQFDIRYPWYVMKDLNTLCMLNVPVYGIPVRSYWSEAEHVMIDGMQEVLVNGTDAEIERYCNAVQEQAYADGLLLLNSVNWYLSANANTMKNGRDPETGETLDTLISIPPMQVSLDSDVYLLENVLKSSN